MILMMHANKIAISTQAKIPKIMYGIIHNIDKVFTICITHTTYIYIGGFFKENTNLKYVWKKNIYRFQNQGAQYFCKWPNPS